MDLWPTSGTVDVLGERYGKVDARAHRKRIGSAGSAIEARFRADLTPRTLIMTGRHGAFEPWWHRYEPEDAERAGELARRLGVARQGDQPVETPSARERPRASLPRGLVGGPRPL